MNPLISIQKALQILSDQEIAYHVETLKLPEARDRILAKDVTATQDSPSFSNSAMDGFAVRWEDVKATTNLRPSLLEIVGESQAGIPHLNKTLANQAVRISTGAEIPPSLDTVIPIEDCHANGTRLQVNAIRKAFQHVRYQGEEFKKGTIICRKGQAIQAPQIALLASMGISQIEVYARPRVALILTGTELIPYDSADTPHKLRDSNAPMLQASIEKAGGELKNIAHVEDDLDATIQAIQKAETLADIIFFSGGVSVGPHDHVREASERCGFEQLFWRVNQKPGKPLMLAKKGSKLLFGLPGNPVSAFMCYKHYGERVIHASAGRAQPPRLQKAILSQSFTNPSDRAQLIRLKLEHVEGDLPRATILERQASHMLTSISEADGYVVVEGGDHLDAPLIFNFYPF
jgi:molybdopterin molybdotransferase